MTTFSITLPDEQVEQVQALADQLGLTVDMLIQASLDMWLSQNDEHLQKAVEYVLAKNADLYRRLADNSAFDGLPAWSPDGRQIAFESTRDGNSEIYGVNSDGSNPRNLTNHRDADYFPAWQPMPLQGAGEGALCCQRSQIAPSLTLF